MEADQPQIREHARNPITVFPPFNLPALLSSANPYRCIVIVAAHPDDEVIGAGAQLPNWGSATILHVTDGSPLKLDDAVAAGFSSREAYARARRREAETALALAGIPAERLRGLGFVDQETSAELTALTWALCDIFSELQPEVIITHAYEGGHPDHDATAFAVRNACRGLQLRNRCAPTVVEMTAYHNRAGEMISGEFLAVPGCIAETRRLTPAEREFKKRLFTCFLTQDRVLAGFKLEQEAFRVAPGYDFTQPPHDGRLYYEMFDWGMTGARWRELAKTALVELQKSFQT